MRNRTSLMFVSLASSLAMLHSGIASGQSSTRSSTAPGTFVGRDSLDARKEAGTASRTRLDLRGTATWTIELDSLDLRPKFTIRIEIPEPSPVTIILRSLDSLPPRPGQYSIMLASTGASHSRPGTLRGDVYTRERDRNRLYSAFDSHVLITSSALSGGLPIVNGTVAMRGDRYADAPTRQLTFDYVRLDINGEFSARAASVRRPRVAVTPRMQETVLWRALDGFIITHAGAINGDGSADSTRQPESARRFLESRWSDAATVEHLDVQGMKYELRLRGRHVPVVCEVESSDSEIGCATFPTPVNDAGAKPGSIAGRLAIRLPDGTVTTGSAIMLYLLPNPVPIKDAFRVFCAAQDSVGKNADRELEARVQSLENATEALAEKEFMAMVNKSLEEYREGLRRLFASRAAKHATSKLNGQFGFTSVPSGNYLLYATLPAGDRYHEWFAPVAVRDGRHFTHDLNASNANTRAWTCGMPLPFPAIDEAGR